MPRKSAEEITRLISKARRIKDLTRKQLLLAAIVAEILRPLKLTPILVGGAAVQFYTFGKYSTFDIDMIMPSFFPKEKIEGALTRYGFRKIEDLRHWLHPKIKIPIEFPPSPLQVGNLYPKTVNKVKIEGITLEVIRLEDLILDRLIGAQEWRSEDMKRQAEALLLTHYKDIDWSYLHSSANKVKVLKLLQKIQRGVKRLLKAKT